MSEIVDLLDFRLARREASFARVSAFVKGKRERLQSLAEVLKPVRLQSETYVGVRPIEIDRIAGSESHAEEFSKSFLPLRSYLKDRWSSVNEAFRRDGTLPAIRVFELNGRYYVRDGRHRVSVARFHGAEYIDAEIVKITAA